MSGLTLIASYPKSGNTWLRAFLASHLRGSEPIDLNADLTRIGNLTARAAGGRAGAAPHQPQHRQRSAGPLQDA